jgi:hypothetical protein
VNIVKCLHVQNNVQEKEFVIKKEPVIVKRVTKEKLAMKDMSFLEKLLIIFQFVMTVGLESYVIKDFV